MSRKMLLIKEKWKEQLMATKWTNTQTHTPVCGRRGKKTSQGCGNVAFGSMNKNMKRSWKKYRGQGR